MRRVHWVRLPVGWLFGRQDQIVCGTAACNQNFHEAKNMKCSTTFLATLLVVVAMVLVACGHKVCPPHRYPSCRRLRWQSPACSYGCIDANGYTDSIGNSHVAAYACTARGCSNHCRDYPNGDPKIWRQ